MQTRRYLLDLDNIQYKQVKLPFKTKIYRTILWLACTIVITVFYSFIFHKFFGSPKENLLNQQLEDLRLHYSMVQRDLDVAYANIEDLRMSDEIRYRPVLAMDSLPGSIRNPGYGGVDRYRTLDGYIYSDLMKATLGRIEGLKNMVKVQDESFKAIEQNRDEWERMYDHLPMISPVDVSIPLGDGLKFREVHPVLGTPQWHNGQDFRTPYGTEVFATGNGKVIAAGWNSGGFGNYVMIDHGYGYQTIYGHLSSVKVTKGMNVIRGDLIGLTGSSGTSSGPHLHYQIDFYGHHKDPLHFFNDDLTEDEYFEMIQMLTSSIKLR
ncbi:MAG TPA: M23 family metallopeptidase [Bacteroidales bacterium]|nr:M23 family metallopeptidase [Bacteroidales bacterium]HPI67871.1 M23 family metallopeptidase [Bacteroidales bacterium]HPR72634.1 M23 family metallopeptidase [Bacteroidales bacterium]